MARNQAVLRVRKRPKSVSWFRTPDWATDALMEREHFGSLVWECAAGDGCMAARIAAAGHRVIISDIEPRAPDVGQADFFDATALPQGCSDIVTNPPFSLATDFAHHALANLGVRKLALFVPVAFMEGSARQTLYADFPPARFWVFSRRVTLWAGDAEEQRDKGGQTAFMWAVWERFHHAGTVGFIP